MANLWLWLALIIGIFLVPALVSHLLRASRCPGASVLGGLLTGILLGPQILGAMLPDLYERRFVGGVEERQTLHQIQSRHGADVLAARHADIAAEDFAALKRQHAAELDIVNNRWREARSKHQRPMLVVALIVTAVVLLAAGPLSVASGDQPSSLPAAVSIGLWTATLPSLLAFAAMHWWWNYGWAESILAAAALGIGSWVLTTFDRDAADQAEIHGAFLIQLSGRIASVIALLLVLSAAWILRGIEGIALCTPLLALPLGWTLSRTRSNNSWVRRAIENVGIPALAACVALKAELFGASSIWLILILMILSADGRWFAAFMGAMLPGHRRGLRTMRLVMGSMAAGPTQLAITALAAHAGMISTKLVLPLMLGAALIEATAPARRGMARRIAATEAELDQSDSTQDQ